MDKNKLEITRALLSEYDDLIIDIEIEKMLPLIKKLPGYGKPCKCDSSNSHPIFDPDTKDDDGKLGKCALCCIVCGGLL